MSLPNFSDGNVADLLDSRNIRARHTFLKFIRKLLIAGISSIRIRDGCGIRHHSPAGWKLKKEFLRWWLCWGVEMPIKDMFSGYWTRHLQNAINLKPSYEGCTNGGPASVSNASTSCIDDRTLYVDILSLLFHVAALRYCSNMELVPVLSSYSPFSSNVDFIREDVKAGVYVENLTEEYVSTIKDLKHLLIKLFFAYSYNPSTKAAVIIDSVCSRTPVDDKESCDQANSEDPKYVEPQNAGEEWDLLHKDCIYAVEACVEGELKHFHKARYMLERWIVACCSAFIARVNFIKYVAGAWMLILCGGIVFYKEEKVFNKSAGELMIIVDGCHGPTGLNLCSISLTLELHFGKSIIPINDVSFGGLVDDGIEQKEIEVSRRDSLVGLHCLLLDTSVFRKRAVDPVRFRLRVSLSPSRTHRRLAVLEGAAFLLLASSSGVDAKQGGRTKSPSRETKKKCKTGREVERFVVCDLVNVRGKVVISSFAYKMD
ncbi:hypothetical protein Syun_001275 [Stephania yunnanensis]|uniref:Uncharacterized protein n=1 Tax=Stephania yunnanensis TaxID=152371 RepID=A0AAP0Q6B4_9MAGN